MNTRFRKTPLLAAALGAVLLSSTVSAGGMEGKFEQKSRGQAEGHAQSRQPAGHQPASHEQTGARNGNHYGTGHGQGNPYAGGQDNHGNNQGNGQGSGQHNGYGRPPGHVDTSPVPPRSGSGNAWNSHTNNGGHGDAAPPRDNPGQHNGYGRPPGNVDATPVPPRNGSGNAWNSHGNGKDSGNGSKDNWRKDDNRSGDHFNNWNSNNHGSGNGQKFDSGHGNDSHFDTRGHFDRTSSVYRPPRVVPTLPAGYRHYSWNGAAYYQHAGLWYRPYGTRYVVTGAPYGLYVSYLPGYSSNFWFGSTHYFYSDNTYYLYEPAQHGYVVTHSPYASEQNESDAQPADSGDANVRDEDLYIYPAQGQSEQQQNDDRYECHQWGAQQSGYDPIDSDYDADRRADYLRAMTACLTGRGYSVR